MSKRKKYHFGIKNTGAKLRGMRGGLLCPFLKNEKKCPDFGNKWL